MFAGSFHGRTHLTMAMTTSKTVYRAGHAPLPSGIFVAPFPDPLAADEDAEVARALARRRPPAGVDDGAGRDGGDDPRAGARRGRLRPGAAAFVDGLVERCRPHGILFIADEVQSGFGRTGEMFAVEHYGIEPDVICMAKGIASGFPFSALGTRRELDDRWPTGSHGGTYGGNPIGCAAALATIEVLTAPGFLDNVRARGAAAGRRPRASCRPTTPASVQVRGLGLMVADASSTTRPASPRSCAHCLRRGPR